MPTAPQAVTAPFAGGVRCQPLGSPMGTRRRSRRQGGDIRPPLSLALIIARLFQLRWRALTPMAQPWRPQPGRLTGPPRLEPEARLEPEVGWNRRLVEPGGLAPCELNPGARRHLLGREQRHRLCLRGWLRGRPLRDKPRRLRGPALQERRALHRRRRLLHLRLRPGLRGAALRGQSQRLRAEPLLERWQVYGRRGLVRVPLRQGLHWRPVRRERRQLRSRALPERRDLHRRHRWLRVSMRLRLLGLDLRGGHGPLHPEPLPERRNLR